MEVLRNDILAVQIRLDHLNNRTRENEVGIAILHDRHQQIGKQVGKTGAVWGGSLGALLILAAEAIRWISR